MSPHIIIISILCYFSFLMIIAWYTSRQANNASYFLGNKASPWYAVAFGMIGDSLSGVTFISVPGSVATGKFYYMQMVFGYVLGYIIIAKVLLPLYYKLNLTSIYSYLNGRFGSYSQKTGSFYFLVSRLIGAALRLYLAAGVIQLFVFDHYNVPFAVTVAIIIILMLLYTYKGGIKTLVWTDTFQSSLLLLGVILSITAMMNILDFNIADMITAIKNSDYSQTFIFDDWRSPKFFPKQFLSGAFIAVVMTGLDQNMMQKNLSCPNLKDAQKNIYWFSIVLVFVNLFFVALGALLYIFASQQGIALPTDDVTGQVVSDKVFPALALGHLGTFAAIIFILGLTASTFSSADSVLTTLTTSFCIDFLKMDEEGKYSEKQKTNTRHIVHIVFAVLLLITILCCELINKTSVLELIFSAAAYTYGPLLGLFAFGLFTKRNIRDKAVPYISVFAIAICYLLKENSQQWFNGYKFGYELLLLNGLLMYVGLWVVKKKKFS